MFIRRVYSEILRRLRGSVGGFIYVSVTLTLTDLYQFTPTRMLKGMGARGIGREAKSLYGIRKLVGPKLWF